MPAAHVAAAQSVMDEVSEKRSRRLARRHTRLDNRQQADLDALYQQQQALIEQVGALLLQRFFMHYATESYAQARREQEEQEAREAADFQQQLQSELMRQQEQPRHTTEGASADEGTLCCFVDGE